MSYADEQLEYLRTRGQADAVVKGVGADAPVVANKFGGKQSKMEYDHAFCRLMMAIVVDRDGLAL